jgi:hypothetical protein
MLRQCCCSFSLETGTFIIGIIEMVSRPHSESSSFLAPNVVCKSSHILLGSRSRVVHEAKLV